MPGPERADALGDTEEQQRRHVDPTVRLRRHHGAARRGALLTPPLWDGALDGITRDGILEIAGRLGIPAREERLTRFDLFNADECFLTGTGAELIPVVDVDDRRIGNGAPGEMSLRILEAFRKLITEDGVHVSF